MADAPPAWARKGFIGVGVAVAAIAVYLALFALIRAARPRWSLNERGLPSDTYRAVFAPLRRAVATRPALRPRWRDDGAFDADDIREVAMGLFRCRVGPETVDLWCDIEVEPLIRDVHRGRVHWSGGCASDAAFRDFLVWSITGIDASPAGH